MLNSHFKFEQLIQPFSPSDFFSQYWEQQPLLISRNDPTYYSALFSLKDFDTLLQFHKLKYPKVKRGKIKTGEFSLEILEGMEPVSIHDLHQLYNACSQEDTLVTYRVESYWKPLEQVCRELEEHFSYPVGASLFLTPKNAQGFPPCFDPDDRFILRIEGSSVWRIYNSLPYLSQAEKYQPGTQDLPAPEHEICLKAGDFLYIPRGSVHEVLTTNTSSIYLSIGELSRFDFECANNYQQAILPHSQSTDQWFSEPEPTDSISTSTGDRRPDPMLSRKLYQVK